MSLPRYQHYRNSGLDWLGEIPAHWDLLCFKRDLAFLTSGSRGWADHYREEGALFIRIGNLTRDGIQLDLSDIQKVAVPPGTEGERTRVRAGDVLFSITAYLGSVAVVPENIETAYVSQHVALARTRQERLLPKWAAYVTLSYIGATYLETRGYGGTKIQLSLDDIANLPMTVPGIVEQSLIITFLERETSKIDALIAEQQKLIELLREKRQAVISHAVTKGLNPSVPMKDSGIEWLGEAPEHWKVNSLKRFSVLHRGHDLTELEQTEGPYPVVTSGGITGTHGSFMAQGPGVVTGRYGSTGRLFYIEENFWPHNTSLYVSNFHGNHPRFVWYSLQTVDFAAHAAKAAVPGIDRNDIHALTVVVPPVNEQIAIALFLDQETEQIDMLTSEATTGIDLLQERRTALISAAVTGKIDVCGLVTAEPETEAAA